MPNFVSTTAVGLALLILALNGLLISLQNYRASVTSNTFSRRDYFTHFLHFIGLTLVTGALALRLSESSSGVTMAIVAGVCVFLAFVATELTKQFAWYMRPGTIGHHPCLIRFWPSWVFSNSHLATGYSTVFSFSLVDSFCDVALVIDSNAGTPTRRLGGSALSPIDTSHYFSLSYSRPQETAITQSGCFRDGDQHLLRIVCFAPGFEPSMQESPPIPINMLVRTPVRFVVMPTSIGDKSVVFKLLDMTGVERGSIQLDCTVWPRKTWIGSLISAWWWPVLAALFAVSGTLLMLVEKIKEIWP